MVEPSMGLEVVAFVFRVVIIGGLGSIKGPLISAFIVGQVVSLGSLVYAPLAQMAPFAIMLLILLGKPAGLSGSPLVKRQGGHSPRASCALEARNARERDCGYRECQSDGDLREQ